MADRHFENRRGEGPGDEGGAICCGLRLVSPQQILTTVMTRIVVDKTIDHAKPHSICFLPRYQRNEIFVLIIQHTDSDLKVHALHYANELLVRVRLSKTFANSLNMQIQFEKMLGKRVMTSTRYQ